MERPAIDYGSKLSPERVEAIREALVSTMVQVRQAVLRGKGLDPVDPVWDKLVELTKIFPPAVD